MEIGTEVSLEVVICTVWSVPLVVAMDFSCGCDISLLVDIGTIYIEGTPLIVAVCVGVVDKTPLVVAVGADIVLIFRDNVLLLLSTFAIFRSACCTDSDSNAGISGVNLSKRCIRSLAVYFRWSSKEVSGISICLGVNLIISDTIILLVEGTYILRHR